MVKREMIGICILIFIISIYNSFAECTYLNNESLLGYFSFEDDVEVNEKGANAVNSGVALLESGCVLGDCGDFESTESDYLNISAIVNNTWVNNGGTICGWLALESYIDAARLIIVQNPTDDNEEWADLRLKSAGNVMQSWVYTEYGASSDYNTANDDLDISSNTQWRFYCNVFGPQGQTTLYVNTTNKGTDSTNEITMNEVTDGYIGLVVYNGAPAVYTDGKIDEVTVFNYQLKATDISNLYNSGAGCDVVTEVTPNCSITINSNLTDTINYNDEEFYVSYNATLSDCNNDIFNCYLRNVTTTLNSTTGANLSINNYFNLLIPEEEQNYTLNIYCENSSISPNTNDTTSDYNLAYDRILPELVINSDFVNHTTYEDDETLNLKINVTDTNLFAVELNLTEPGGTLENYQFYDNIVSDIIEINITNTTSSLGIENNYSILVTAWDSHTAELLKDEMIEKKANESFYRDIQIISDKTLKYNQLDDKIEFEILPSETICYYSPSGWTKIINSEYPEHYISFGSKVWIDEYSLIFVHIGNELCLYNDQKESIITKSMGDLNTNSKEWFFNIEESPDIHEQYYPDFNSSLTSIDSTLTDIYGVLDMGFLMVSMVILWLGLWVFGYHAIQTYNTLLGGTMIVLTTPINIFFSYAFREALNQGTGFVGIAFGVMTAWTFGIFVLIYKKTNKRTVVQG